MNDLQMLELTIWMLVRRRGSWGSNVSVDFLTSGVADGRIDYTLEENVKDIVEQFIAIGAIKA